MTKLVQIPVFDLKGTPLEAWKIEGTSFGKANSTLLAQAIRVYGSNSHQKTSKVKTRGEVDGSTRKIYRQKGTGNARHGAKYAPIFVGGGIAHGPTGVRPENMILPKAMRRRALGAALQAKMVEQTITGIAKLKTFSGKTASVLKLLALATKHPKNSVLVVTEGRATSLYQSLQNLQGVTMKRSSLVNAYDLVSSDYLVLTKKALDSLLTRISL
ncbi:MAG: 50S ribosomal protein L4 [bacterium]